MRDFLESPFSLLVGVAVIILAVAITSYTDRLVDVKMAKTGLQQCNENSKVLWKKECN